MKPLEDSMLLKRFGLNQDDLEIYIENQLHHFSEVFFRDKSINIQISACQFDGIEPTIVEITMSVETDSSRQVHHYPYLFDETSHTLHNVRLSETNLLESKIPFTHKNLNFGHPWQKLLKIENEGFTPREVASLLEYGEPFNKVGNTDTIVLLKRIFEPHQPYAADINISKILHNFQIFRGLDESNKSILKSTLREGDNVILVHAHTQRTSDTSFFFEKAIFRKRLGDELVFENEFGKVAHTDKDTAILRPFSSECIDHFLQNLRSFLHAHKEVRGTHINVLPDVSNANDVIDYGRVFITAFFDPDSKSSGLTKDTQVDIAIALHAASLEEERSGRPSYFFLDAENFNSYLQAQSENSELDIYKGTIMLAQGFLGVPFWKNLHGDFFHFTNHLKLSIFSIRGIFRGESFGTEVKDCQLFRHDDMVSPKKRDLEAIPIAFAYKGVYQDGSLSFQKNDSPLLWADIKKAISSQKEVDSLPTLYTFLNHSTINQASVYQSEGVRAFLLKNEHLMSSLKSHWLSKFDDGAMGTIKYKMREETVQYYTFVNGIEFGDEGFTLNLGNGQSVFLSHVISWTKRIT